MTAGDHKEDVGEIILAYLSGQPAPPRGERGSEPLPFRGDWAQALSLTGPAPHPYPDCMSGPGAEETWGRSSSTLYFSVNSQPDPG